MTENDKLREEVIKESILKYAYSLDLRPQQLTEEPLKRTIKWTNENQRWFRNMIIGTIDLAIRKVTEEKDKQIDKYKDDFIQTLEENGKLKRKVAELEAALATQAQENKTMIARIEEMRKRKGHIDDNSGIIKSLLNEIGVVPYKAKKT